MRITEQEFLEVWDRKINVQINTENCFSKFDLKNLRLSHTVI